MNAFHDTLQLFLQRLFFPGDTFRILAHFKTRNRNTASIGCFTRRVTDSSVFKDLNTIKIGRHVGAFRNGHTAILDEGLSFLTNQLILCRTWHSNITGYTPGALATVKAGTTAKLVGIR